MRRARERNRCLPRNAPATRAAILEAARACFTEGGYEHVGVRDVAGRAGVNAALVIRYFGSKMQLFAEAVARRFMFDYISDGRSPDSDQIARVVLERNKRGGRVDAVLALVRSAPDPHAAAILNRLRKKGIPQPAFSLSSLPVGREVKESSHLLPRGRNVEHLCIDRGKGLFSAPC